MNAINPSLIREAVLAGPMPSVTFEQAEPVALLSSTLHVMAHIAGAGTAHAQLPSTAGAPTLVNCSSTANSADPLTYTLIGSLLASLSMGEDSAQPFKGRAAPELHPLPVPDAGSDEQPGRVVARVALSPWQERRAKELMSSQMDKGLSIARIASECSLSRSHFSRAFKKNTGLSPRDWFLQMRLDKAKGLLSHSILSISQISLDCGFADQSHFTRVFARVVGITPFNWRRSMGSERARPQTFERRCAN